MRHISTIAATAVLLLWLSPSVHAAPFNANVFDNPPNAGYGHSLLHVSTPSNPGGGATTHRLNSGSPFVFDLDLGPDGVFGSGDVIRFGSDAMLPSAVIGHDHAGNLVITGGVLTVGGPWTGTFPGPSHLLGGHLDFFLTEQDTGGTFFFAPVAYGRSPFNSVLYNPEGGLVEFYLWGRDPELNLGTDLGVRGSTLAVVPEPATGLLALFGSTGGALAARRRRRRVGN
jgi:hypothetical protein